MAKHLFLEGPIQIGKSTLLRQLLAPYASQIAGFSSQRLTDFSGDTIAFRIVSAQDFRLTMPYEEAVKSDEFMPDVLQNYGVFRVIPKGGKSENFYDVFENIGLKFLGDASNKRLILLDEIGGVELKNEPFRNALYDILNGDIPCIGVIKSHKKATHLADDTPKTNIVGDLNLQLRDHVLNSCNGEILTFDRDDSSIKSAVEKLISDAFL